MSQQSDQQRLLVLRREQAKQAARDNFAAFIKWISPDYDLTWYHQILANKLDRVERGESRRLIVTMPPQHGKSDQISHKFPAYLLGRNPDLRVLSASYSADLASRNNRTAQRVIESDEYQELFPGTKLASRNMRMQAGQALRNSDLFEVVGRRGSYKSAGISGGLTGWSSEVSLIDDVIKDSQQARSVLWREHVWEWFCSTMYSRQSKTGSIVILMTRWHEDDLVGRLVERMESGDRHAEKWEMVNFPAIKEADDEYANPDDPREIGEALWPARYPIDELNKRRSTLGDEFTGLYQQRPKTAGGTIFQDSDWGFWYTSTEPPPPVTVRLADGQVMDCPQKRLPEKFDRWLHSWDMTFKDTKKSDYTVGFCASLAGAEIYLRDRVRDRMDFVRACDEVVSFRNRWPLAREVLIEEAANGAAIISSLRQREPGLIPIYPEGSKDARSYAATPAFRAHNIFLPHPNELYWSREVVSEFSAFPRGKFDDQVDALCQLINWVHSKRHVGNVIMIESYG